MPRNIYSEATLVPVEQVTPNSYNPNVMPDALFQELLVDIKQNGFVGAIICTQDPKTGIYIIIDGEHRYRAAKQLGFSEIPVIVPRENQLSPDEAKISTFRWNHERGFFDPQKTTALIADLSQRYKLDELVRSLGVAREEISQWLSKDEIPKNWNLPMPPQSFQEMPEREALTFFLPAEKKEEVIERLDKYSHENKLKDRNEALYQITTNNPSETRHRRPKKRKGRGSQ